MKKFYVYILASKRNGTLYIGMTNDLARRMYEHRNNLVPGFTNEYGIKNLVYVDICDTAETAITHEKQLKEWKREWKLDLIEKSNPEWHNLYEEVTA